MTHISPEGPSSIEAFENLKQWVSHCEEESIHPTNDEIQDKVRTLDSLRERIPNNEFHAVHNRLTGLRATRMWAEDDTDPYGIYDRIQRVARVVNDWMIAIFK